MKYREVLFVCNGTTCRSAMSDAILNYMVQDGSMDISVGSAGTI